MPETTGRPAYHPATMLKIYVYGYINQVQSSRRLERETARNVEMMWLTGRLTPDFKTIADFRKNNGAAIRSACRQFVALCRGLNLFAQAIVAIDGSRFKAVNSRDRSFSRGSIERRMEQVEARIRRAVRAARAGGEIAKPLAGPLHPIATLQRGRIRRASRGRYGHRRHNRSKARHDPPDRPAAGRGPHQPCAASSEGSSSDWWR